MKGRKVGDSSIREKSGVAFLVEVPPPSAPGSATQTKVAASQAQSPTPAADLVDTSSRILAAKTILLALAELGANDHPVNLRAVADVVHARADVLLPLTDRFVNLGFLRVTNETTFGDNDVQLTDAGETWANENDRFLLAKLAEL